mgnify:CR=1 FL=1
MSEPLLKVENLVQHFPVSRTYTVKAVNGVSFNIYPGETYGLVGESGSGKTTIGRSIIRLYNPTDGRITFNGKVISGALDRNTRSMLRSDMQMIFQDPFNSLNPRMSVLQIISEPLGIHFKKMGRAERRERVAQLLETVGLPPDCMARYPHEFSGGQRQRIGIARALAVEPKVLLMDEPTSALDPISTSKIEDLATQLREQYTIVIVTHNMQQAVRISDCTAFFLLGELVEYGQTEQMFSQPQDKRTEDYITGRFG